MFHRTWVFLKDEIGQDLAEYCLIMALISLVALGILFKVNGGINGIWATANTTTAAGATAATNSAAPTGSSASKAADTH